MHESLWAWTLFGVLVLAMLAVDLDLHRPSQRERDPTLRSSVVWSATWIGVALAFGLIVLALYGPRAGLTYLTAYVLEKSLSVDNVFVFAVIFSELSIPRVHQRRVLLWGVIGALVMRALLIAGGVYLLARFHWVIYIFGALIVLAAVRILWGSEKERQVVAAVCNVCNSWVGRIIPITPVISGPEFFVRRDGRRLATPLFVALLVVETTDLVFALDSVPAVLSITRDPFLVYTSNVFAMLGLRSLYFVLAGVIDRLHYLRTGLAAILLFVGARMLLGEFVDVPVWASLAVIVSVLALAVWASLQARPSPQPAPGHAADAR